MFALTTGPVMAEMCRYVDGDGATHYTTVRPEPDRRLLSCDIIDEKRTVAQDKAWHAALAKVKIGMTDNQMRAADPLLRHAAHRRVVESASGVDVAGVL